jgi:hypothetical protein
VKSAKSVVQVLWLRLAAMRLLWILPPGFGIKAKHIRQAQCGRIHFAPRFPLD